MLEDYHVLRPSDTTFKQCAVHLMILVYGKALRSGKSPKDLRKSIYYD